MWKNPINFIRYYFATYKWNSFKEVQIHKWEYQTSFMRSSGPGGQSVNTTNSKAQLRLKLNECAAIDENILNNLKFNYPNLMNKNQQLVVRSQVHKSQGKNLEECFEKVQKILFQCSVVKQERSEQPFQEPEQTRQKRLQSKKKRSEVKSSRQKRNFDF